MDIYSKEYAHHSRLLGRTVTFRRNTAKYLLIAFLAAGLLHSLSLMVLLATGLLEDQDMIELTLAPYERLEQLEQAYMEMQNPPTLVDVPEEARVEEPPDDPDADVADKNAAASDLLEDTELPEGPAYSEGDLEIRTMEDSEEEEDQQHDPFAGGVPLTPRAGGIEDFKELVDPPMWTSDMIIRPEYRGTGGREGRGEGGMEGEIIASAPSAYRSGGPRIHPPGRSERTGPGIPATRLRTAQAFRIRIREYRAAGAQDGQPPHLCQRLRRFLAQYLRLGLRAVPVHPSRKGETALVRP